ncbi:MAG: hypothetical protein NT149_00105 [Candidatus Gottesmanbacteria bacterium]|nr:hypothetical protein [Candidatus Gottesmanbacteria bacterium]
MAGNNERKVQQIPEGVNVRAYLDLRHEVTEQFPTKPAGPPPKIEPRLAKQLPQGVTAEDMIALRGEQPA